MQTVPPSAAEAVLGREIDDPSGKEVGRLVDILVDETGQPQAAVIDFGGFFGVGNRKVAVHWSTLHFNPRDGRHKISLNMTPDQLKGAPEYTSANRPAPVVTPTAVVPAAHLPAAPPPPASSPASSGASPAGSSTPVAPTSSAASAGAQPAAPSGTTPPTMTPPATTPTTTPPPAASSSTAAPPASAPPH